MDKCIKSQSQWCISWCWDKTEAINQLPLMVKSAKSILYTSEAIKLVSWICYSSRVYSYVYVYVCEGVHPYPLMQVHGGGEGGDMNNTEVASQRVSSFISLDLCLFLLLLLFICLEQSLWLNRQLAASASQAGWLNCPWDLPVFTTQHQGYRHEPPHCLLHGYWVLTWVLRSWHLPSKHFICSTARVYFKRKQDKRIHKSISNVSHYHIK